MHVPDYYATLGVARDADQDQIKKAYRRLARKYHPDVSKEPRANERMSAINEAYQVLSDPEKRKVYDTVGHQAWAQGARSAEDVRPPPGWDRGFERSRRERSPFDEGPNADFDTAHSDFFEEWFGRGARAGAQRRAAGAGGAWPGEDQYAEITLDLEEAYRGAERTLTLQSLEIDAAGQVTSRPRTLHVKIPAGVGHGQLIRLVGQGSPGIRGGAPGDLYLKVHVRTDDKVRVAGRDVHMHVVLTPWEAALGANITVSTPSGPLAVTVPAGSTSGRKLRLRGRGIPGREPGDLYLELDVAVPGAVTAEQRAAWEALAKAYPKFEPRPAAGSRG